MFHEWLEGKLDESMTIYVQGVDYGQNVEDLDQLAETLKRKVLYPIMEKFPQDLVVKHGSMMHGILSPDGSYYSQNQEKMLNFYIGGWPQDQVAKAIQGLKYFLDEMKVKYGPFKQENSGMFDGPVVRIPVLQTPPTTVPTQLNLNNANAITIFRDILGLPMEQGGFFEIHPQDLLIKIDNLPPETSQIHQRDPYSSQKSGHATVWHGGLSDEGIHQRLKQIRQIAQWAVQNGYDELYVA